MKFIFYKAEDMRFIPLIFLIFSSAFAGTNLGTITGVRNGFATIKECEAPSDQAHCDADPASSLDGLLDFATSNQCIASTEAAQASGVELPRCPSADAAIKGLDNTYPSGAIFALYTGDNDSFIYDLVSNYLKDNTVGRFNLVLPRGQVEKLRSSDPKLLKVLNSNRVNVVDVATTPNVGRWMQDSFQFTMVDGKPALFQLDHFREQGSLIENRLACELARKCDIPYYIPPDVVDSENADANSLNSGGNLEVMPGGTFYTGIVKTPGFDNNVPFTAQFPFRTDFQKTTKESLTEAGNKLVELDTSFLQVGHVDEIINIVKTNKPAPCDFAVMVASPNKAFELIEKQAKAVIPKKEGAMFYHFKDFFLASANAGAKPIVAKNRCTGISYYDLETAGQISLINSDATNKIYNQNCLDGEPVEEYVKSDAYNIVKEANLGGGDYSIQKIMDNNEKILVDELKRTTSCAQPPVVHIPVFFRNGLSFAPDLVNGVVNTTAGSASKVILPRSYFNPFDSYVKNELKKYGVKTTFAHDMGYHLAAGEVHCGTNSARICKK